MPNDKEARGRARELAQARYWLRWHVLTYTLVNVGLVFIWWNAGMGYFWPVFSIFFWGMGVVIHYLRAYRTGGHGWIDRETEKILHEQEDSEERQGHEVGV